MLTARHIFQAKVQEVEEYYRFLRDIVQDESRLHCPNKRTWKHVVIHEDLKKILKANCFLLLYNLIESSIRSSIADVYDAILDDGMHYEHLSNELKKIWVHQKYRELGQSAHPDRYRDLARDLIEFALSQTIVELDTNRLPTPGNLNADKIRQICGDMGLTVRTHKNAKGGEKLETVREMRNKLAHGLESFSECGRSYSFEDLSEIKKEVLIYLRGVMRTMDNYVTSRKYCA